MKDGSGKGRRQAAEDEDGRREGTDRQGRRKELKVRMIRARKTGGTHWSGEGG